MTNATRPRAGSRMLLAALASLVVLFVLAPAAQAARDPLAGGSADLHFKKGFMRKLNNLEVVPMGIGSGTITGNKASVPVDGGKLDPTNAQGYVETGGGFKLTRGERGVPIVNLTINTVRGAVYANIAKAHMQLGELQMLTTSREGFGARVKAVKVVLTAKAAKRISNRLGLLANRRINAGRVLSNAYTAPQPQTVTILPQGAATLVGDTATFGKFAAKGVEVPQGITAIAPATKPTPASFEFPIAGGTLAPDASSGTVETNGGVQILKKAEPFSPTMKLSKVTVDFKEKTALVELEILPAPPFPGAVGRSSIADLVLTGAKVIANPVTRQIAIEGAEARLQAVAASTLNNVFNQPAPEPPPSSNFVVGDSFGKFSMTVQAQ
ncbi:MAG TPA: hypothetical protein VG458_01650 [Solirubrobacterales bacterium]|nr:hypothetical protein [Solirubrobacterales bacterium]